MIVLSNQRFDFLIVAVYRSDVRGCCSQFRRSIAFLLFHHCHAELGTYNHQRDDECAFINAAFGLDWQRLSNKEQATMAHVLRVAFLTVGLCIALSSAAAAQTETMGETTVLNAADSQNGNLLLAQEATLSAAGTLQSLSFYVTQATGTLVLGVYTVTPSGMPGTLVAQTAEFTPANGWNVASTTTNPTLQAGNYYLAYFPSSSGLSFVKENNTGNCYYSALQFTAILPQTFNGGPNNCTPTEWSFYATLNTAPLAPTLTLTDSPASPSVLASAVTGTVVTTLMATWSDGTAFSGTLGFAQPNTNDGGLFALNGNQVVVNGSLASLGGTTQQVTVAATQSSTVVPLNVSIVVTAPSVAPPPPPPVTSGDPTSGVLPAYNDAYANWSRAGLLSVGGIPNRTTVCATVSPSGGDDFTTIQNALNACPAGQVVMLAPGAFSFQIADLPLQISTGVTLRGAGNCNGTSSPYCQSSIAVSNGALAYTGGMCGTSTSSEGACPNGGPPVIEIAPVAPNYNYSWDTCGNTGGSTGTGCGATALTADAAQGQTTISVASTAGFSVGQVVLIDEASGAAWQTDPVGPNLYGQVWAAPDWLSTSGSPATGRVQWAKFGNNSGDFNAGQFPYTAGSPGCWYSYCDRATAELHVVAAIGAGAITFDSPLTVAFRQSGGHNAQVYNTLYASNTAQGNPISFLQYAGLENISVLRGTSGGVGMEFCQYCWMRNVEVGDWYGGGVDVAYSIRSELNTIYVHHAWDSVNNGGEYPIAIDAASTELLLTNSITNFAGKGMVARAGGAGSVVSYNYQDDTMYDAESGIGDYWVDMGTNGSHYSGAHHILFEGNWGDNLDNDNTHGNQVYLTYFRNWGTALRSPFIDPSIGKEVNDAAGLGYACGTSGPSGCSPNAPGPLRASGPMMHDYWFAFVGNVLGTAGVSIAANNWTYQGSYAVNPAIWMMGWNADANNPTMSDPNFPAFIFRHGDYDYVNGGIADWTSGYSQTLPNSFYLASAPASFSAGAACTYPWPWVTPTGTSQIQANSCGGSGLPAKARFDAGAPFSQP
jgi:hypothetical protein